MLTLNNDFVIRKVYGKTVLMPIRKNNFTNNPVLLNSTAECIIQIAKECNSIEELFTQSCIYYHIKEKSDNGTAILDFIQQLQDCRVLIETEEVY